MTFTDSCFSIMANENVECINQLEAIPSDDVKNFFDQLYDAKKT